VRVSPLWDVRVAVALLLALPPRAGTITPADGATGVPIEAVITAQLDGTDIHPDIDLVNVATGQHVEGTTRRTAYSSDEPWWWRWWVRLRPSWVGGHAEHATYVFTPARPLQPGTRYEIRFLELKKTFTTASGPARAPETKRP
jgi:hypothetical protein